MIGRVVKGKYKIYDEVGSGGFATVYLGRNMETNEIVAIKVLSRQFTSESRYVERFRREAGLAERLQHPNIVRILDHGIEDGMHFLVMEFVEGLTLDEVIERQGRLSVEDTLSYTEQTCAGLQAAYRAGVVHRDVKPANLMITLDGTVKIMDFGIARMEAMAGLTQSGMFMGTPRYISPEMARGSGADIRSDLYALGLLMYEMLAGAPPFDAENPWAVLRQQIESEPPPIRQIRPDAPGWVSAVIARAVAKDPAQRFQTPAEMLAALKEHTATPKHVPDAVSTMAGAGATSTAIVTPQARKERPKGLIIGLVAAVVVVALALAAVLIFGLGNGGPTPTPTEAVALATTAAPIQAPTNTARVVVITNTPEDTPIPAPPTETSIPPTDAPPLEPTDAPEPTETPEPTDTPEPTTPPTQAPTRAPQATAAPTQSPTAPAPTVTGRIAYSAGGTLHIADAATGKDTASTIGGMRQPDFRRDGVELLADGQGNPASIVQINPSAGSIIREQTSFTDDFHPFWSPDGTRFAYDSLHHGLGGYTMLYTQGITNGRPQPEVTLGYNGQQIRGHSPVWMHDDHIAFTGCDYWPGGSGGSKCGIYRIPSWGESRPALIYPGSTDMRPTDNHGGQLVFMSQEEGNWEVYIMSSGGGAARNLSQSPTSNDGLATFSPDGKMVAFASNRGGGWAVWVVKADGTGLTKLFGLPGQPTAPWYEDSMSWAP